jgi:hypothetical protein
MAGLETLPVGLPDPGRSLHLEWERVERMRERPSASVNLLVPRLATEVLFLFQSDHRSGKNIEFHLISTTVDLSKFILIILWATTM